MVFRRAGQMTLLPAREEHGGPGQTGGLSFVAA